MTDCTVPGGLATPEEIVVLSPDGAAVNPAPAGGVVLDEPLEGPVPVAPVPDAPPSAPPNGPEPVVPVPNGPEPVVPVPPESGVVTDVPEPRGGVVVVGIVTLGNCTGDARLDEGVPEGQRTTVRSAAKGTPRVTTMVQAVREDGCQFTHFTQ